MWLCTNTGFVSVVADRTSDKLMVRARQRSHLVELFGKRAKIVNTPAADYHWRTLVTRKRLTALMARLIARLDYHNFKDSVRDDRLHDMYALWWGDHFRYQRETEDGPLPLAADFAGQHLPWEVVS